MLWVSVPETDLGKLVLMDLSFSSEEKKTMTVALYCIFQDIAGLFKSSSWRGRKN